MDADLEAAAQAGGGGGGAAANRHGGGACGSCALARVAQRRSLAGGAGAANGSFRAWDAATGRLEAAMGHGLSARVRRHGPG